jgi:hypothetical protein
MDWRKLRTDELHYFFLSICCLCSEVQKTETSQTCSTNGEYKNAYKIVVGNLQGKRLSVNL